MVSDPHIFTKRCGSDTLDLGRWCDQAQFGITTELHSSKIDVGWDAYGLDVPFPVYSVVLIL